MDYYASYTGTLRNIAAMHNAGFGMLVSRAGHWIRSGPTWAFRDWVADCGAWADFQAGLPFDEEAYERFLVWIAAQDTPPIRRAARQGGCGPGEP